MDYKYRYISVEGVCGGGGRLSQTVNVWVFISSITGTIEGAVYALVTNMQDACVHWCAGFNSVLL